MKIKILIIIIFCLSVGKKVTAQDTLIIKMDRKSDNHAVFYAKVKTTLHNIVRIMQDTTAYTEWLYACKKVKLLQKISPQEWILYFQFDVKYFLTINLFFLNDPFLIAKTTFLHDEETGSLIYKIAQTKSDYKIGNTSDQIENFDINWTFKEKADFVAIRYEVKIESKAPFFLGFLVRDYIEDTGFITLRKLGSRVDLDKYSKGNP